jgi:hypothetical protein
VCGVNENLVIKKARRVPQLLSQFEGKFVIFLLAYDLSFRINWASLAIPFSASSR